MNDNEWRHSYSSVDEQGVPTETIVWSTNSELYVIVGVNDGRLLCWRVDDLWELEWMGDHANCWNGCRPIESLCVFGNLLLVGAGRKLGVFALPDVRHDVPMRIGSPLRCHPKLKRFASVVSCILNHTQQSLVTLCWDGTLREWTWKNQGCGTSTKEPLVLRQKRKRDGSAATTKSTNTTSTTVEPTNLRKQNRLLHKASYQSSQTNQEKGLVTTIKNLKSRRNEFVFDGSRRKESKRIIHHHRQGLSVVQKCGNTQNQVTNAVSGNLPADNRWWSSNWNTIRQHYPPARLIREYVPA